MFLKSEPMGRDSDLTFLPGPRDAPVVLVFASGWGLEGDNADALRTICAELRGLGASLFVFSSDGVWWFRPDDDVERFERSPEDAIQRGVARLINRYEVERDADGRFVPALFVVAPDGAARFSYRWSPSSDASGWTIHRAIADGLGEAGRSRLTAEANDGIASPTSDVPNAWTVSRRDWILATLVSGFALALGGGCRPSPAAGGTPTDAGLELDEGLDVVLNVNGVDRPLRLDSRVSLLDALRERLGLTGSKKGCDHGQCGACTVLIDGRRVCSCLIFAVMAQGTKIKTIEGLAQGDALDPVQAAFVENDALQCGYCTPGQIMSAVGLIAEGHAQTPDEVREQMSGNICRCGAYPNIVAAIQIARRAPQPKPTGLSPLSVHPPKRA